ncbi:hypothetical protein MKW98_014277 [Papaver atlanticum]|uniref:Uncharacterized protein n=1 Tax=Papaver atlanticum TaxID=357466 RepID=A0AAD4SWB3_9MAGN|nr:hypothetical protein MKW98_014277 [Papaver atlanticum]
MLMKIHMCLLHPQINLLSSTSLADDEYWMEIRSSFLSTLVSERRDLPLDLAEGALCAIFLQALGQDNIPLSWGAQFIFLLVLVLFF